MGLPRRTHHGRQRANHRPKHVNIHLNVYEGTKYYVRNISWVGNTVYNSDLLQRILQLNKGDVYNQTLMEKRLTSDDDAVGNLYYNNGYVFYRLDPCLL